jgi:hypothetical protein
LPALSALEIVLNDAASGAVQASPNGSNLPYVQRPSLTPSVIQQLNPLTAFSFKVLSQSDQFASATPSSSLPHLTSLVDALSAHHNGTLKSFSLASHATPCLRVLNSIQNLVESCSIAELEYIWPDLDPEHLRALLPPSVCTLRIAVANEDCAFDVLWVLIRLREEGGVKDLVQVVLVFEERDDGLEDRHIDGDRLIRFRSRIRSRIEVSLYCRMFLHLNPSYT